MLSLRVNGTAQASFGKFNTPQGGVDGFSMSATLDLKAGDVVVPYVIVDTGTVTIQGTSATGRYSISEA